LAPISSWRPMLSLVMGLTAVAVTDVRADEQAVKIGWLSQTANRTVSHAYLDQPPADEGIQGARLGIADNNTTGRFTGQSFELAERLAPADGDIDAAFRDLAAHDMRLIVTDLAAPELLSIAALSEAAPATIFNTAAPDDRLRGTDCRANILHLPPSRAMLADALVQYLATKNWPAIFLVVGRGDGDREFAADIRHAAKKFGARVVQEKPWTFVPGARRTDTGHFAIQAEVARFTRASAMTCSSSPTSKTNLVISSLTALMIRGWLPGPKVWCRALGRGHMSNGVPPNCKNAFCTRRSAG
jgi:hypothetical protein